MRLILITALGLSLCLAGCGDSSEPTGGTGGSSGSGGSGGGKTQCEDLGTDAYFKVSLSGAVTESVDWKPSDMTCGGSILNSMQLAWNTDDYEFLINNVDLTAGTTGSATGRMSINKGDIGYISDADGCTVEITTNNDEGDLKYFVEGTATCGELKEIGGSGAITVTNLAFATYVLAS